MEMLVPFSSTWHLPVLSGLVPGLRTMVSLSLTDRKLRKDLWRAVKRKSRHQTSDHFCIRITQLQRQTQYMYINVVIISFTLRMTNACHRKCVPPHYKEAELTKGESVCLDRCVAKYLDLHERLGRKLTELSVQDEELMRKAAVGSG